MHAHSMLRALHPTVPRIIRTFRFSSTVLPVRAMSHGNAPQHEQSTSVPQTRMQKTNAKEFYCLTEKDVRQSFLQIRL